MSYPHSPNTPHQKRGRQAEPAPDCCRATAPGVRAAVVTARLLPKSRKLPVEVRRNPEKDSCLKTQAQPKRGSNRESRGPEALWRVQGAQPCRGRGGRAHANTPGKRKLPAESPNTAQKSRCITMRQPIPARPNQEPSGEKHKIKHHAPERQPHIGRAYGAVVRVIAS